MCQVLLVDADEGVRQSIQRGLIVEGRQVSLAGRGQDALQILKTEGAEVVITEANLPDIPGHEFIAAVHQQDAFVPVIVVTDDDSWETSRRIRVEGAPIFYYGLKPVDVKEVRQVVDAALRWRRARTGR